MEWLFDPTIWAGLLTLVVLEIVLGIDNLIFIAILADKLPPHQRDKARLIGLSLAMLMRLGLLTIVSWLVTLTTPLFALGSMAFSGRDLILLLGGVFLLFKATVELHERMEGVTHVQTRSRVYAGFGAVVAQIVVLDAVFSLDAVITAVGMVDNLYVMMAAVIISIGVMILASKPLTRFVNAHPTVVVLCLSFLLMIGLSLVAEGLGFHIPKGYLYAAIGFSILIEALNQFARRNFLKQEARVPLRDRTADSVLRLMGGKKRMHPDADVEPQDEPVAEPEAFGVEERNMVSSVLALADRSIRSIMTPRSELTWVNLDDEADTILRQLQASPHSGMPVARGQLDQLVGIARTKDLVSALMLHGRIDASPEAGVVRAPILLPDTAGVLGAMDTLKRAHGQLVLVTDEFGIVQGLLTPVDILEAIAGEFPDEDEQLAIRPQGPDLWEADGAADLHQLEQVLDTDALVGGRATTRRWPASCWRASRRCRNRGRPSSSMAGATKSSQSRIAASRRSPYRGWCRPRRPTSCRCYPPPPTGIGTPGGMPRVSARAMVVAVGKLNENGRNDASGSVRHRCTDIAGAPGQADPHPDQLDAVGRVGIGGAVDPVLLGTRGHRCPDRGRIGCRRDLQVIDLDVLVRDGIGKEQGAARRAKHRMGAHVQHRGCIVEITVDGQRRRPSRDLLQDIADIECPDDVENAEEEHEKNHGNDGEFDGGDATLPLRRFADHGMSIHQGYKTMRVPRDCSVARPANSPYREVFVAGTVMKNLPMPRTVALLPATGQASKGRCRTRRWARLLLLAAGPL